MEKSQHEVDTDTAWKRWWAKNTLPNGSQEFTDISLECRTFIRREKSNINLIREGITPPTDAQREAYQKAYNERQTAIHATDVTR